MDKKRSVEVKSRTLVIRRERAVKYGEVHLTRAQHGRMESGRRMRGRSPSEQIAVRKHRPHPFRPPEAAFCGFLGHPGGVCGLVRPRQSGPRHIRTRNSRPMSYGDATKEYLNERRDD